MALIAAGRRANDPLTRFTSNTWPSSPMVVRTFTVSGLACRSPCLEYRGQTKETSSPACNRAGSPAVARPRSGETSTESWEVIANEEEAAIGLSGRISLNGLWLSPGPVKRIVAGDDRRGIARVAGTTPREAGLIGAPRIGTEALGGCAGWESPSGDAFGAVGP